MQFFRTTKGCMQAIPLQFVIILTVIYRLTLWGVIIYKLPLFLIFFYKLPSCKSESLQTTPTKMKIVPTTLYAQTVISNELDHTTN